MALRLYFRPAITHQELEKENQELRQINETIQREIAALKLQLSQVYKLINGFKSERFSPEVLEHQLSLFAPQETTPKETASKETITYTQEKQKHPGRHALPEHLPVSKIIIEPEQDTPGLKKIGEEITETLGILSGEFDKKAHHTSQVCKKGG